MKKVCRVCFLIDGDSTKKDTTYCHTCDADLCKECEDNWIRRGKAVLIEKGLINGG